MSLGLRTAADLLQLAALPRIPTCAETNSELRVLRCAMTLFHAHRRLRREAARDPGAVARLAAFESEIAEPLALDAPCSEADGGRVTVLGLGVQAALGDVVPYVEAILSGRSEGIDGVRTQLLDAMTDAAIREDPVPAACGPHLGLTYLALAPNAIHAAVAEACGASGRDPGDVPIHELRIPRAPRETLAAMVCRAEGVEVPAGVSALDALASRRVPRPHRADCTAPTPRGPKFDATLDDALAAAAGTDAPVVVYTSSRLDGSAKCADH